MKASGVHKVSGPSRSHFLNISAALDSLVLSETVNKVCLKHNDRIVFEEEISDCFRF